MRCSTTSTAGGPARSIIRDATTPADEGLDVGRDSGEPCIGLEREAGATPARE
ncbi:hypothetical protein HET69_20725 [Streptomyces sp. CJ_13]|uniref:hypothetical protein n=1 Tax=Streptomyces sp. CJ_13 TaxID=2724943 RepID=UPI001BDD552E|nr:hypothetical protein [Streptomyces sp. CJ_13]MBT1186363.1 hypothetical protein [Streptomyces sp. CJ_13]